MHSTVEELLDVVDAVLGDRATSREVVRAVIAAWGGGQVYVPKSTPLGTDAEILDAFTGANHAEVCRRFAISRTSLYELIRLRGK